jgi:hypothetical protein
MNPPLVRRQDSRPLWRESASEKPECLERDGFPEPRLVLVFDAQTQKYGLACWDSMLDEWRITVVDPRAESLCIDHADQITHWAYLPPFPIRRRQQ